MSETGRIALNNPANEAARRNPVNGILYQSDSLLVRAVPGEDRTGWVVSFDHFRNEPGFAQHGFGETFLREEG